MQAEPEPISVPLILHLHRQVFQHADGRGGSFKAHDNAIVSFETGRRQVVFEPVSAGETPFVTTDLVARYLDAQHTAAAHPLVLLAAFVLDLLAIHPVADGNGRVARLVTARELLHLGYGILRQAATHFTIAEIRRAVPGTSDQTIRLVLNACREAGLIRVDGTGRSAVWERLPAAST